jgi:hypothetical protein
MARKRHLVELYPHVASGCLSSISGNSGGVVDHPTCISLVSQREALTDLETALGKAARPASSRATGTRKGEQDT